MEENDLFPRRALRSAERGSRHNEVQKWYNKKNIFHLNKRFSALVLLLLLLPVGFWAHFPNLSLFPSHLHFDIHSSSIVVRMALLILYSVRARAIFQYMYFIVACGAVGLALVPVCLFSCFFSPLTHTQQLVFGVL